MTIEDAIKTLKYFEKIYYDPPFTLNSQACTMAISALEKQESQKPEETDAWPHRIYCPNCYKTLVYNKEFTERLLEMKTHKFCHFCGQAIDWSKYDEQ